LPKQSAKPSCNDPLSLTTEQNHAKIRDGDSIMYQRRMLREKDTSIAVSNSRM